MYDNELIKHDTELDRMADEYRIHMLHAINSDTLATKMGLALSAQSYANSMYSYGRLHPFINSLYLRNKLAIQNAHILRYGHHIGRPFL